MGKHKHRSRTTSSSEYDASSSKRSSKKNKTKSKNKKAKEKTKKRKNWSADLDKRLKIMQAAVEDVVEKKMSVRKAAIKWGVKRSTLSDRVTGKVGLGRRSGPPSILTRAEEQMLAEWIISMAQRGVGINKTKLLKTVKKILDKDKRKTILEKKENMPGNKWYRQFVKRNPQVKLVTCNPRINWKKVSTSDIYYEALNNLVSDEALNNLVSDTDSAGDSESESESEEVDSESESESEVDARPKSLSEVNLEEVADDIIGPVQDLEMDSQPRSASSSLENLNTDPGLDTLMAVGNTVTISTTDE